MLLNRREYVKREPNAQEILRRGIKETGRKAVFAPPNFFCCWTGFKLLIHSRQRLQKVESVRDILVSFLEKNPTGLPFLFR